MQCSKRPPVAESVNHLIRPAQERYRKCYAKRSRNVEIENEHDVRRLLDGAAQTVFPGLPRDVLSAVGMRRFGSCRSTLFEISGMEFHEVAHVHRCFARELAHGIGHAVITPLPGQLGHGREMPDKVLRKLHLIGHFSGVCTTEDLPV
jgi:hypothetical protein